MHVLSLNLTLGLVQWSRLLNAKGFLPSPAYLDLTYLH